MKIKSWVVTKRSIIKIFSLQKKQKTGISSQSQLLGLAKRIARIILKLSRSNSADLGLQNKLAMWILLLDEPQFNGILSCARRE